MTVATTEASSPFNNCYRWLALAYALVALVATVQLVRIAKRVPHISFTTQKVFHAANVVTAGARAITFFMRHSLERERTRAFVKALLMDGPGLIFLSTYATLALFWAEIYHNARNESTKKPRMACYALNIGTYAAELTIWIALGVSKSPKALVNLERASSGTLALASVILALAFAVYGIKLIKMLRLFPEASVGRTKKLREIAAVTACCVSAFAARSVMLFLSARDTKYAVDIYASKTLNIAYYTSVEIVPSALVLYILRKLPPKHRNADADDASDSSTLHHPLVHDSDSDSGTDDDEYSFDDDDL